MRNVSAEASELLYQSDILRDMADRIFVKPKVLRELNRKTFDELREMLNRSKDERPKRL